MRCSSASGRLQREPGVHETIPVSPVGARLRANAAGKSLCGVRPQADSYSGRTRRARNHLIAPCRSSLASERGGEIVMPFSSASGLLQREPGVHETIPVPAVGARLRANAAGKSLCGVRPQADSYRANAEGKSLCGVRPQADAYSANTAGKCVIFKVRPQAGAYKANQDHIAESAQCPC